LLVPLNIMCSKKCASPVMPGTSLRLPARTQLYKVTLGMSRSVQMMTFMPLARVAAWTCSAPGTRVAGTGLAGGIGADGEPEAHQSPAKRTQP
jgi:hypothetical protein